MLPVLLLHGGLLRLALPPQLAPWLQCSIQLKAPQLVLGMPVPRLALGMLMPRWNWVRDLLDWPCWRETNSS